MIFSGLPHLLRARAGMTRFAKQILARHAFQKQFQDHSSMRRLSMQSNSSPNASVKNAKIQQISKLLVSNSGLQLSICIALRVAERTMSFILTQKILGLRFSRYCSIQDGLIDASVLIQMAIKGIYCRELSTISLFSPNRQGKGNLL